MMLPGLMSYTDIGAGVALLKKETIDRCVQSYVGKPLVIKHEAIDPITKEKVGRPTPENMEQVAVGYIASVTLEPDGWYWAHGICHNDEAKDCIKKGWRVSHTFAKPKRGPGGSLGGIPYSHEWTDFSGEHLALVERPRYEEAEIVLHSKAETQPGVRMFKLFRSKKADEAKLAADAAAAKVAADKAAADKLAEETANHEKGNGPVTELSGETEVEVGEGKTAKLSELVTKFNEPIEHSAAISPDDEIEVTDHGKVTLADLAACWALHGKAYTAKKNAPAATDHAKPGIIRITPFDRLTNAQAIAQHDHAKKLSAVPDDRETQRKRANSRFEGLPSVHTRN